MQDNFYVTVCILAVEILLKTSIEVFFIKLKTQLMS